MPRLPTSLIRTARAEHSYLPLLLQTCRDLPSARNELRWLREHVSRIGSRAHEQFHESPRLKLSVQARSRRRRLPAPSPDRPSRLLKLCKQRALGKPLQYILGTQPFGTLEILCRKHVLIPRPETENYTLRIAELLARRAADVGAAQLAGSGAALSVLDLCTGSGCIALLLHSLLAPHFPRLRVVGVDSSDHALKLAERNLAWNVRVGNLGPRAADEVRFVKHDILQPLPPGFGGFDLVVSNPPYVTPQEYRSSETSRSVRSFEPFEALVPNEDSTEGEVPGHSYFRAIQSIAEESRAKAVICEMGNKSQFALMCSELRASRYWHAVEIWRDEVYSGIGGGEPHKERTVIDASGFELLVKTLGVGNYRVVVGINGDWRWLGQ